MLLQTCYPFVSYFHSHSRIACILFTCSFFFFNELLKTKWGSTLGWEPSIQVLWKSVQLILHIFGKSNRHKWKHNFLSEGKNPSMLQHGGSLDLQYTDSNPDVWVYDNSLRRGKAERRQCEKCSWYLCIVQQLNIEPVSNILNRNVLKNQYVWQLFSVVFNDVTDKVHHSDLKPPMTE